VLPYILAATPLNPTISGDRTCNPGEYSAVAAA
jgi:hypothetical protein